MAHMIQAKSTHKMMSETLWPMPITEVNHKFLIDISPKYARKFYILCLTCISSAYVRLEVMQLDLLYEDQAISN